MCHARLIWKANNLRCVEIYYTRHSMLRHVKIKFHAFQLLISKNKLLFHRWPHRHQAPGSISIVVYRHLQRRHFDPSSSTSKSLHSGHTHESSYPFSSLISSFTTLSFQDPCFHLSTCFLISSFQHHSTPTSIFLNFLLMDPTPNPRSRKWLCRSWWCICGSRSYCSTTSL